MSGAVLDALAEADVALRALVRDESKAEIIKTPGVEVCIGDLGTPESLPAAFEGVTDLWLLNANSPRAPEHSMNAIWAALGCLDPETAARVLDALDAEPGEVWLAAAD